MANIEGDKEDGGRGKEKLRLSFCMKSKVSCLNPTLFFVWDRSTPKGEKGEKRKEINILLSAPKRGEIPICSQGNTPRGSSSSLSNMPVGTILECNRNSALRALGLSKERHPQDPLFNPTDRNWGFSNNLLFHLVPPLINLNPPHKIYPWIGNDNKEARSDKPGSSSKMPLQAIFICSQRQIRHLP